MTRITNSTQQAATVQSTEAAKSTQSAVLENPKNGASAFPVPAQDSKSLENNRQAKLGEKALEGNACQQDLDQKLNAGKKNISPERFKVLADALAGESSPKEAAKFMKEAYERHPAMAAEFLKQSSSAGCEPYTKAYGVAMSGVRELAKFDMQKPMSQSRNFFAKVADLNGPGSERVKSDVSKLLNENIKSAESTKFGTPYASDYAKSLGSILESDPAGTLRTMEFSKDGGKAAIDSFRNVLHYHPEGSKVLGNSLGKFTVDTAKTIKDNPHENAGSAQIMGKVLSHVETAIDQEKEMKEGNIEKGAGIVKTMAQAVKKLEPQAEGVMDKAIEGVNMLEEHEKKKLTTSMEKIRSHMHDVVTETYRQTLDPTGDISSGSRGKDEMKQYVEAHSEFEKSLMIGRKIAAEQTEVRR